MSTSLTKFASILLRFGVRLQMEVNSKLAGSDGKSCYSLGMELKEVKFNLVTQRFITNRWNTPTGREVQNKLFAAIKANEEVSTVLKPYVLKHPSNLEPYDYPFYPPDAMDSEEFWVLTDDDMRGLHFSDKGFEGTTSLSKCNLSYAKFIDCNLEGISFEMSELSDVEFERCNLRNVTFAYAGGFDADLSNCDMRDSCFIGSHFVNADFSGCDLRGVYFEETVLDNIKVNYLTRFDKRLKRKWHDHDLPLNQLPDLYRSIRVAYKDAELNHYADYYWVRERAANRRHVLWQRLKKRPTFPRIVRWAVDGIWALISGYGVKPWRTVYAGIIISLVYATVYFFAGTPAEASGETGHAMTALYFSFTTFATLGYGDLTYAEGQHFLRLLSTSEAWLGAVMIALFIVVLGRKLMR